MMAKRRFTYCDMINYTELVKGFNDRVSVKLRGEDTHCLFLEFLNVDYANLVRPMVMVAGLLDTSNCSKDHLLCSEQYKVQLWKIKGGSDGKPNEEWIRLKH